MPYSQPANVRYLVETPLTDAEIAALIEESDAEIDRRLGTQDPSSRLVRRLSALITARTIRSTHPGSVAVGEYREDAGDVLEVWEREIERIYRLYKGVSVKATEHRHIDESKRYPEES